MSRHGTESGLMHFRVAGREKRSDLIKKELGLPYNTVIVGPMCVMRDAAPPRGTGRVFASAAWWHDKGFRIDKGARARAWDTSGVGGRRVALFSEYQVWDPKRRHDRTTLRPMSLWYGRRKNSFARDEECRQGDENGYMDWECANQ